MPNYIILQHNTPIVCRKNCQGTQHMITFASFAVLSIPQLLAVSRQGWMARGFVRMSCTDTQQQFQTHRHMKQNLSSSVFLLFRSHYMPKETNEICMSDLGQTHSQQRYQYQNVDFYFQTNHAIQHYFHEQHQKKSGACAMSDAVLNRLRQNLFVIARDC